MELSYNVISTHSIGIPRARFGCQTCNNGKILDVIVITTKLYVNSESAERKFLLLRFPFCSNYSDSDR